MRAIGPVVVLLIACNGKDEEEAPTPVPDCVSGAALQGLLDAAAEGDVIELCGGNHVGTWTVAANVEIVGAGGTTLDGGGAAPVLTIGAGASVTLRNLIVQNGADPEAFAGGIDAGPAASLTLDDCVVRDNAGVVGGILGPYEGSLVLTGTSITGNSGDTGGISVFDATLDGATISGNAGTFYGGGVEVERGGTVTATGTTIESNTSAQYGGGLFLWDGTTFTGGAIRNNQATTSGGGITVWMPHTVRIEGVTVDSNTSAGQGGGISVVPQADGVVSIVDSTVSGNDAQLGGGLHLLPGTHSVQLLGTAVDGNTATTAGGIFFGADGATSGPLLVGSGSAIRNNSAQSAGGILITSPATVEIVDAAVENNSATQSGGGVRLEEGTLVSDGADWAGNTPDDVWVNGVSATSLGADASFTCEAAAQSCS